MRIACLAPLALLALSACTYEPGGGSSSNDTFTYRSTATQPQTVTLVNCCTGEKLWVCEVPVGQQVVVRFRDRGSSETTGQDVMKWEIMPWNRFAGGLSNELSVPPASCRRLDVSLRAIPEVTREVPRPAEPILPAAPSANPAPAPATNPPAAAPEAPKPAKPAKNPSEAPAIELPQ